MAKDAAQLKSEQIHTHESEFTVREEVTAKTQNDLSLDFQKKVTISKHEKQDSHLSSFGFHDSYNPGMF